MHTTIPESFREVPYEDFQDYIKWCNDYTCDTIGSYHIYTFRYSRERFAYVDLDKDRVFVSPSVLT